jgi:hypothetical protein
MFVILGVLTISPVTCNALRPIIERPIETRHVIPGVDRWIFFIVSLRDRGDPVRDAAFLQRPSGPRFGHERNGWVFSRAHLPSPTNNQYLNGA